MVHTVQRFELPWLLKDFGISGQYCVQLFFIISGFLACISAKTEFNEGRILNLHSYISYLIKKIKRLIPALWIVLFIRFIINIILKNGFSLKNMFFSAFLLNGIYLKSNVYGNWYVGTLFLFLLIFPFINIFINSFKRSLYFFIFSIIFCISTDFILRKLGFETGWHFYFWLPRQLPLLAFGVVLYYLQDFSLNNIKNILLPVFFYSIICMIYSEHTWINQTHILYGIYGFCTLYFILKEIKNIKLQNLGKRSYELYLFHFIFLDLLDFLFKTFKIPNNILSYLIYYFILLILTYFMGNIELYVIAYLRKIINYQIKCNKHAMEDN